MVPLYMRGHPLSLMISLLVSNKITSGEGSTYLKVTIKGQNMAYRQTMCKKNPKYLSNLGT